ncbi:TPA: hypothetical protein ACH3X1_002829 [Trebouxia sp. C0004]
MPIADGRTADTLGKWNLPGHAGVTEEVDPCAIDTHTQHTHIPHEVKAPWAERQAGGHFTNLLQDQRKRRRVARA